MGELGTLFKRIALVLLISGGSLSIISVVWLLIFGFTNGAAPIPTPEGDPPTPALVILAAAGVLIAAGFVVAVVYRTAVPRGPRFPEQ